MIVLKSRKEIELMRQSCLIVAEILEMLKSQIKPGITTKLLDSLAEEEALKRKSVPAFKGYSGYPNSLCCSVNDQVVHGMPSREVLKEGDILSIDFGVVFNGFYGDAAITVPVGKVTPKAAKLIAITEECLYSGISRAIAGNRLSDISNAIQVLVENNGFSVVRDFVGHGIGRNLHESPQIPNYGPPGRGVILKNGMVLAIEPMINEVGPDVKILEDGWTAVTCDKGLSAHFEHTVAITEDGPLVLTKL